KEMNRNSNNHAANQIFESFGGAERFAESIRERLSLTSNEIKMLNGSGDRVDLENGFTYNKATCSAILHILRDLRLLLKAEGLDLADVMAVAGVDNTSTTGRLYGNDVTAGSLIAKTGTVNPATTLAGLVTTNNGDYFFMYNMATEGRTAAEIREDWRDARAIIRQKITNFIREEKGGRPIKYKSIQFFEIDPLSALQEIPLASSGGQ
ncbi:MAG: D-alanyl-D-alanine carboxypeptidase, partial [Bdellovibrionaceae bacterium]|nr:D-alanyl-D-alanine carboxypeptidase [Pseudobdellovibrionaceae bacterium]